MICKTKNFIPNASISFIFVKSIYLNEGERYLYLPVNSIMEDIIRTTTGTIEITLPNINNE